MPQGQRVGVVGLGAMGGSIATRLAVRGYDVLVRDLNPIVVQRLVDQGATEASLAEIAGIDLLVLSLPSDAAVHAVLAELAAQEARPRIVLEMSTVRPETVRAVPAAFGVGVEVVDAPVSGGPADALGGTLSLLVGIDAPLTLLARSVLETLGAVHLVGRLGDGKVVKLVNNMISMSNVAVAAEALQLGVDLGLDPERLYRVLSVIVTTNMFGDILSNEAAAIVGGLGFAPSLNVAADDSFALAQASHGSAPEYRRHGSGEPDRHAAVDHDAAGLDRLGRVSRAIARPRRRDRRQSRTGACRLPRQRGADTITVLDRRGARRRSAVGSPTSL